MLGIKHERSSSREVVRSNKDDKYRVKYAKKYRKVVRGMGRKRKGTRER